MRAYNEIVCNVLENGHLKGNRTGIRTLAVPNQHFSHDMSEGFPLLTTKKMAFKTMCVELEGFIKGITSKKWYQDRKCKIWNEWANPHSVHDEMRSINLMSIAPDDHEAWDRMKKEYQAELDDLGPIYGYQWRRFGETYDCDDDAPVKGFDQFKYIVDTLKSNPNDRRMVCSAWNPNQLSRMALPACHICWVVTVINQELHLHWTQRSCDLMLGVPFNIASYGMLMELLCLEANLKPGNLSGMLCDCHIYENQIAGAEEQCGRIPGKLPRVSISHCPEELLGQFDIFEWTHEFVDLIDYNPQQRIDFGDVAV